jgi:glucosamine--fructose-6-phosphate aminotransferase (isomerizing)
VRALRADLPPAVGGTDSEVIFQALAAGHRPIEVLSALHGRAALAWVDRTRPGRPHLARAALSPLCVAVNGERNLYWASKPRRGSVWSNGTRGCASAHPTRAENLTPLVTIVALVNG